MRPAVLAAALSVLVPVGPVAAQEWVVGLSGWHLRSGAAAAIVAEVHGRPRWQLGRVQVGLGAAAGADSDGNAWAGAGLVAEAPLGGAWFAEASVMPGIYHARTAAADLGSDFEIRSLLGVGYRLRGGSALSLAAGHLSNASIGDMNPGTNGLSLRFHRQF